MSTNVEVEKNGNESTANLVRRFTKRMQGAGIVQKVRSQRYFNRMKSANVRRRARLRNLIRKKNYERLLKLGKIVERPTRGKGGKK
jgi:ribosomal protein S21